MALLDKIFETFISIVFSVDDTVCKLEKTLNIYPGTVRNKSGRDTRSDKKLKTVRRQKG